MSLWEYLGAWSWTTKWLYHLNWDATDSSGNWNNWTLVWTTYWIWKLWSGSASFDWDDYITLNSFWITSPITISAWIKTATKGKMIFADYTQASNLVAWYQLNMNASWYIQFVSWKNTWVVLGTDYAVCSWTTDIATNTRVNVMWVWDWTNLKTYTNWLQSSSCAWANAPVYNASIRCRIWCNEYVPNIRIDFFNWQIDEVIIENRAWTAEEIRRYYTYASWRFAQ